MVRQNEGLCSGENVHLNSLALRDGCLLFSKPKFRVRWLRWLEREFTDRKVLRSNPTSASRLPLSRLGKPGIIPALVLPSSGMAARHRYGVAAGQRENKIFAIILYTAASCHCPLGDNASWCLRASGSGQDRLYR
ncbi:hypothetical protein CSKR_111960 [Clonorchis sinensis]|uniref:Uncharacterized protein n=1 Tax=Clonorchis sinensis TaxID=79923 RepID=A0A3R7DCY8_CLOSI|nr:hypothetical protein CSKR_111960 [Clonorchis sinensis]